MIVDCFPFFGPTNEEIAYLRINLLKDYVDKFIIVESNKTHSGKPVTRKFLDIAKKHNFPMDKIIYVEHDIPEDEELKVLEIDRLNAGINRLRKKSVYARIRERLQKDAVMEVMDQFNDDDIFIYGDADEIIKPESIAWCANMAKNNPNIILKIPLAYLQGRADLRIFHKNGKPVVWWRAMFFASKKQIMEKTINNIRCGNMEWPVRWPTHQGKICQDMGWHFAWMGPSEQRKTKADSFAHAYDRFSWQMEKGAGTYSHYDEFVSDVLKAGDVAPDGNPDHILQNFSTKKLPDIILKTPFLRNFFLPGTEESSSTFQACECGWCEKLQWPLLHKLDDEQHWFEIPRSCSVTIKETFPKRTQIFRYDSAYNDAVNSVTPIVVMSDPVERFLSLVNVYLVEHQRYYEYGKQIFQAIGMNLDELNYEQRFNIFMDNLDMITSNHQVHHFHPQVDFIDTDSFKDFKVIMRNEVNEFFGISTIYNQTRKRITREHLLPAHYEFIEKAYKKDYDFLKLFEKIG